MEALCLARQVDLALEKLTAELTGLSAGTIVMQIRNDEIGKFGVRHLPVDCGQWEKTAAGMNADQVKALRKLAIDAINQKKGWTHGEIAYDFVLRQGQVYVSLQVESNYNMANLLFRRAPQQRGRREISNE